ncbi:MAG: non-heme iron oxygenase ferredoxin subunit [Halioglobus sp.]|nr:non-heme iron oxygenase ferredoxin subunit [Halioglobus sp.]
MTDCYQRIAAAGELPAGKILCITVGDREILLCHTAEGYFAVDNQCSHAAARLSEGKLKGHRILCPLHGAAFDVRDGCALSRPASQPIATYALRVQDDGIFIRLPPDEG